MPPEASASEAALLERGARLLGAKRRYTPKSAKGVWGRNAFSISRNEEFSPKRLRETEFHANAR
ncbi:MAG: hypothetical protein MSH49_05555, partial [[Eubacterium] saphenum]|nr:hypothetical protein [[Eubacterium] saphenum]